MNMMNHKNIFSAHAKQTKPLEGQFSQFAVRVWNITKFLGPDSSCPNLFKVLVTVLFMLDWLDLGST